MKPIHKFNNGRGATICTKCSVIISTGLTEDLYCEKCKPKQETLEEAAYQARRDYQDEVGKDGMNDCIMFDAMKIQKGFKQGAKWQQEQIGRSEFLQKLRGTLSDAEARRLIFETFKNK